jgi:hypothetical protein
MTTLAAYYDGGFAPISHFPAELVIEIFSHNNSVGFLDGDTELWTELDRLANVGLLTLSQVCSRWHSIVFDTPRLWSVLPLHGVLWRTPFGLAKTIALLSAALARSRNAPLSVAIFESLAPRSGTMTTRHPVFQLLAQHSHRWRSADFTFSMANVDFSCLKGKLPLLRSLRIITPTMPRSPHTVDFFVGASQLKSLTFSAAALDTISTIVPIPQLNEFGCWGVTPDTAARALSLASKLPWGARLFLSLFFDVQPADTTQPKPLHISPTSLTISCLEILSCHHPHATSQPLGHIFESLTLPNLEELTLKYHRRPLILEWPHEQFLRLCERSAFSLCLNVLRIVNLRIPERELIQVLSVLHTLEHLEIMERNGDSGAASSDFLITDNVLRALTFPARRLIPRLRHFACDSHWQLQCACDFFLDFVKSRLEESASSVFRVEIWSPPDGDETLFCAASFRARLQDLAADSKGTLLYDLTARVV